jgi:PAS domain S-box-containing protein
MKKIRTLYLSRNDLYLISIAALVLVLLAVYSCFQTYNSLERFTMERGKAVAYLTSTTASKQLESYTNLGVSLSTRVYFRALISEGLWQEAAEIVSSAPGDFEFLERIFITDTSGILMSDTPSISEVHGQDFSFRDWYKGVTVSWEPYVSRVYQRTAPPRYNVVAIAVPIFDDSKVPLGILVLQIKLDSFAAWAETPNLGPNGYVYLVDQAGNIITHPDHDPQDGISNFKHFPIVTKVLSGEQGSQLSLNTLTNQEEVYSYFPISPYGWGAVTAEPSKTAFAERNSQTTKLAITWIIGSTLIIIILTYALHSRGEIKLQREQEKTFLHSIGDGVFAIDRNYNITLWNPAAEQITGWTKKEAMGKNMRSIIKLQRSRDRQENIHFIEEAMAVGESREITEDTILIKKDGQEIQVGDSASPIFSSSGSCVGAIVVFRDLSADRENSILRSNFTYASHQLRTPVSKTLWRLELVANEKLPQKLKKEIEVVIRSVKSIRKLIEQLLEVSTIDQGIIIQNKKLTNIPKVVQEISRELQDKIKIDLTDKKVDKLNTDPKLLKRILHEIIDNSILYKKKKSDITLKVASKEKGILFEISDLGIGITEENQPLVGSKFFRGSNFDTTDIPGAGLGLYIARAYTTLLDGKFWFESEEGKGSKFYILLPR